MNQMQWVKFWEINSGWHTGGDTTHYILTHALPVLCLIQVILLTIPINNQNTTNRNFINFNKWIIATIGILLFFNLMGKIIFLKYYRIPFPNIEHTWRLFILTVFSSIIILFALFVFRKHLDFRKSILLYSIPITFFILNEWVSKM